MVAAIRPQGRRKGLWALPKGQLGPGEEPAPFADPARTIGVQELENHIRALATPPRSILVALPLRKDAGAASFGLDLAPHLAYLSGKGAAGTYLVVFTLFVIQTVTGFALAGAHGTEPWAALFGWLPGLIGLQLVRVIHHLIMWAILAFMIHHVYSALLVDHIERNGLMSSIFSGYKFVTRREIQAARDGGPDVQEVAE